MATLVKLNNAMDGLELIGCNGNYGQYSLNYFLDAQVALGIRSVALYNHPAHLWLDRRGVVDLPQCLEELGARGITVRALHPLPLQYSLFAERGSRREAFSRDYLHACAYTAARVGASYLCLRPFGALRDQNDSVQMLARTLEELYEFSTPLGVRILIQTEPGAEGLSTLKGLRSLIDILPGVGGLLDTVSMSLAGETIPDWVRRLGPAIGLVRFADGRNDGWRCWGEGVFPGSVYAVALRETGYQGPVLLGDRSERYQRDPVAADRRNLTRARALLMEGGL